MPIMPIDIDLDTGFRQGAFDVAAIYYPVKYFGVKVQFVDEGKQPDNIPNINRPVNLDLVSKYTLGKFTFNIDGGLTSSYFSHNGSGNGYKNNTGFTGGNIGAGVSYKVYNNWSLNAQVVTINYQESDITAFETFTYGSIGLKYSF